MVVELILFVIGVAAIISSINFIAKSTSNITHSFGIPEYLASTIIISFVFSMPNLLIMLLSNLYDVPVLGFATILGFTITTMTLVMGTFLLRNEVPIAYEGYRNATFMWTAALLLLIVSVDRFIDRMEAIFMLVLFAFYTVYVCYRTEKSTEYVYLKTRTTNIILYPLAIFAIIISSFVVVGSVVLQITSPLVPMNLLGFVLGSVLAIPMLDVIRSVFKSTRLTFDSILGNVIVSLTLLPGIAALILPIAYETIFRVELFPIVFLNLICLSFAMLTRFKRSVHRATGIALISAFAGYILLALLLG